MPAAIIAAWIVLRRLLHAFVTTGRLLTNVAVLRALPWPYIRRLPLKNAWIAAATATLAVSLGGLVLGLAVPGRIGVGLQTVAYWTGLAGVISSWARALHQRRRFRR
jgi:hypothetical protein